MALTSIRPLLPPLLLCLCLCTRNVCCGSYNCQRLYKQNTIAIILHSEMVKYIITVSPFANAIRNSFVKLFLFCMLFEIHLMHSFPCVNDSYFHFNRFYSITMPNNVRKKFKKYSELQLIEAIAARRFDVPVATLHDKIGCNYEADQRGKLK